MSIATLQRFIPARLKNFLKPYYRRLFPNALHVLFAPTYRCNYRCSYCPVVTQFDYSGPYPRDQERSVADWLAAFDRLPTALIYITGGEPFLYKELPELINGLRRHRVLGIVTNGTANTSVYERIDQPLHLNISFHREFVSAERFVAKLEALRRKFHINVNIVATPENLPVIEQVERLLDDRNVSLHVDPYVDPQFEYSAEQKHLLDRHLQRDRRLHVARQLDHMDYSEKRCSAGRNYIVANPNGDVFTCAGGMHYNVSPLVKHVVERGPEVPYPLGQYRLGNLFDSTFRLNAHPITCKLPCTAACDLDNATIKRVRPAPRGTPARA